MHRWRCYAANQIVLVALMGNALAQSAPRSFDNPSSIKPGRPPLFAPDDILVPEKGVIGLPPTPVYDNALSVFRRI